MHFVHNWNKDVETALSETFHSKKIVEKLQKGKENVKFLTNIIKEQEEENFLLKKRNEGLEKGKLWIDRNLEENPGIVGK